MGQDLLASICFLFKSFPSSGRGHQPTKLIAKGLQRLNSVILGTHTMDNCSNFLANIKVFGHS